MVLRPFDGYSLDHPQGALDAATAARRLPPVLPPPPDAAVPGRRPLPPPAADLVRPGQPDGTPAPHARSRPAPAPVHRPGRVRSRHVVRPGDVQPGQGDARPPVHAR